MQLNQKKVSHNMNYQKLTEMLFHGFEKFQVRQTILFKQYALLLNYSKIKIEKKLIIIISSIRYLARQGIALRDHNEENWSFSQLLNLRAEDDDNLKVLLLQKSKKYMSPSI